MKQALHIFRKDVRHLWPELAVSVGLLIAFFFVSPQTWMGADHSTPVVEIISPLLKLLIPVVWLVMIARVVHEEDLVGDQQFWVTRPYSWRSLLGAKALFVAVCIALPMLVMQCCLLMRAGISLVADVRGMASSFSSTAIIVWLTFFAIATVTVNVSRTFMTLIGVAIVWAAMLMTFGGSMGPRMTAPFTSVMMGAICGSLIIGTLLYVYATRDIRRSRLALAGTGALFFLLIGCLIGLYLRGVSNVLVRSHYPISVESPLRLVFHSDSAEDSDPNAGRDEMGSWVTVHLPIGVEGLPPQDRLHDTNALFTLDAPGYHYESPWRPVKPGEEGLSLLLPKGVYARVQSGGVRLHLSLVLELLTPGTPQVITAADHFSAPNHGSCLLLAERPSENLVCRYAYESPLPTRVTGTVADGLCGIAETTHLAGASIREMPAGTRPDPVIEEWIQLDGSVCPGTKLTFLSYHPAGNYRMELDVPAIKLGDYRMS